MAGTAGVGLITRDLVGGFADGLVLSIGLVGFALSLTATGAVPQNGSLRPQVLRVAAGVVLMMGGLTAAIGSTQSFRGFWTTVLASVVLTAGLAMVAAPFVQAPRRDADAERRQRHPEEERADLAIHRTRLFSRPSTHPEPGGEPRSPGLARQQEREMRRWPTRPSRLRDTGFRMPRGAAARSRTYTVTIGAS